MASILTHPAVPLALAAACGQRYVSRHLLLAGVVASVLPDLDALGLGLGIPYGDTFGHRGLSHSILFALLLAAGAAQLHRTLRTSPAAAFVVVFISCVSHGLLDACTSGGLGVAFFSPFSNHRYFFPWRPLSVSPLDAGQFLSGWGLRVLRSEVIWVWLPCALVGGLGLVLRGAVRRAKP
jgi:inner membrane protein